ncbi:MAG: copper chaperone PCu(A)C [Alcaligenaceae bacterium]|nr:copper chaperone PCu(A)C [Alcaligenaceae bacterium]
MKRVILCMMTLMVGLSFNPLMAETQTISKEQQQVSEIQLVKPLKRPVALNYWIQLNADENQTQFPFYVDLVNLNKKALELVSVQGEEVGGIEFHYVNETGQDQILLGENAHITLASKQLTKLQPTGFYVMLLNPTNSWAELETTKITLRYRVPTSLQEIEQTLNVKITSSGPACHVLHPDSPTKS